MSTWRDIAKPIIERTLAEHAGADEKVIRRALREAYPFGEREFWPYKVWLDEIKRQRGLKESSAVRTAREAGQLDWFDESGHGNQRDSTKGKR